MLLKEEPDFTIEEYQNRTFRDDPEDAMGKEILKSNMELFNLYAAGGIEYIYDKFKNSVRIDDTINILYDFVHEFSADIGLIEG